MILLSKKVVLSLIAIYFFSNYKPKHSLFFMLMNFYQFADKFMNYVNSVLAPEYFQLKDETKRHLILIGVYRASGMSSCMKKF